MPEHSPITHQLSQSPAVKRGWRARCHVPLRHWFQRCVLQRVWLTFVVMGLAFLGFGAGTINLGLLLMANAQVIGEHGWSAVMDGALWQLLDLAVTGYASMAAYVIFKTCEHRLSSWLSGH